MLLSVRVLLSEPNPRDPLVLDPGSLQHLTTYNKAVQVGAIAKLLLQNKREHDRTAAEWTKRFNWRIVYIDLDKPLFMGGISGLQ